MQVSSQKAMESVVDYLDGELGKLPDGVGKWATMFAVGAMAANPKGFMEKAKVLGIVDEQGMVETDLVRSGFAMAFRGGNTVDLFGLKFSAADGDELLRRMEM